MWRTRHISIKAHRLSQEVSRGTVGIRHVGTKEELADFLTKPLPISSLDPLLKLSNLVCVSGSRISATKGDDDKHDDGVIEKCVK